MTREIKVAHSPDSDDAFMFYALATDKLDTGELHFTHVLRDIQSLNQVAMTTREYDVTAVSFHAYAYIAEQLRPAAARGEHWRRLWADRRGA
jgi:1,4-dihydroxy-6-naphthoate synthase